MSDATRHDATEGEIVVSVADAAAMLGISPGAVRKRLERGQLVGRKHAGQWSIVLSATDPGAHDATRHDPVASPRSHATGHDATGRDAPSVTVTPAALAQLEAIRDQWLAPLVDRIGTLERENGRLEERLTTTERERDALRWEQDRLAEQAPTERASWDDLTRTAAERDTLKEEVARLRSAQDAPEKSPNNRGEAIAPDPGDLAGERASWGNW